MPVLELNLGITISECTAITKYIDHTFPGISLTGTTPTQRAITHMFQSRAESKVLNAIATYFHHSTDGLSPDLETVQNKVWGEKQKVRALSGMEYFNGILSNLNSG